MVKLRDAFVLLTVGAVLEATVVNLVAPNLQLASRFSRSILRFFLLNVSIYGIWVVWVYPFFFSSFRKLPGPSSGNLLWGHGPAEFIKKPPGSDFLRWTTSIPNGGLLYFRGFFNADRLLVTSTESLKAVIGDNAYDYEKPSPVRQFLVRILGAGLILVEGDEHRFQRKHLLPAFQTKQIKDLYPVFWSKSRALLEALEAELHDLGSNGSVEFGEWATRVTVDIIGLAGMGRDFNALKNSDDVLVKNYNELLEPTPANAAYFASNLVFPQWFIQALPWQKNANLARITSTLKNYCIDLVHERQDELKSGRATDKMDILTLLIKSNDFKDSELADQMLTFLAAGHETTSSALTWLAYLLALSPSIQTRLRSEIRSTLPSPSNLSSPTPTAASIDALPFLTAVTNETLRLYPTVPVTIREAIHDTAIPHRDLRTGESVIQPVPRGTRVLISPWAINRSPGIWGEDAGEFRPERWLTSGGVAGGPGGGGGGGGSAEKVGSVDQSGGLGAGSAYSFLTFLHGARSCIGQGFARAELKCLAAALVGRFEISIVDGRREVEPAGVVTTKPKGGMKLGLRAVEGW